MNKTKKERKKKQTKPPLEEQRVQSIYLNFAVDIQAEPQLERSLGQCRKSLKVCSQNLTIYLAVPATVKNVLSLCLWLDHNKSSLELRSFSSWTSLAMPPTGRTRLSSIWNSTTVFVIPTGTILTHLINFYRVLTHKNKWSMLQCLSMHIKRIEFNLSAISVILGPRKSI